MGRIAAIDFGTVRLGLAISDERKIIAQAIGIVHAGKNMLETAKSVAQELARFSALEKIVVGLPLLLSGREGDMALAAKQFGAALEGVMSIPIVYWDERLTSAQVERTLKGADMSRKKRSQVVDKMAAVAILQNYLESLSYDNR